MNKTLLRVAMVTAVVFGSLSINISASTAERANDNHLTVAKDGVFTLVPENIGQWEKVSGEKAQKTIQAKLSETKSKKIAVYATFNAGGEKVARINTFLEKGKQLTSFIHAKEQPDAYSAIYKKKGHFYFDSQQEAKLGTLNLAAQMIGGKNAVLTGARPPYPVKSSVNGPVYEKVTRFFLDSYTNWAHDKNPSEAERLTVGNEQYWRIYGEPNLEGLYDPFLLKFRAGKLVEAEEQGGVHTVLRVEEKSSKFRFPGPPKTARVVTVPEAQPLSETIYKYTDKYKRLYDRYTYFLWKQHFEPKGKWKGWQKVKIVGTGWQFKMKYDKTTNNIFQYLTNGTRKIPITEIDLGEPLTVTRYRLAGDANRVAELLLRSGWPKNIGKLPTRKVTQYGKTVKLKKHNWLTHNMLVGRNTQQETPCIQLSTIRKGETVETIIFSFAINDITATSYDKTCSTLRKELKKGKAANGSGSNVSLEDRLAELARESEVNPIEANINRFLSSVRN